MSNKLDSDSDVSELDPKQLSETFDKSACQLGYCEDPETPLTADTFPSKSGGKPAWLNPEHILTAENVTCGNCEQPMYLLLQLYTPEEHPSDAFHRVVYVFCCKKGGCIKQDWTKSFKVFRSQLPRINPYYPPPEESDSEESSESTLFEPKKFKSPVECAICGLGGSKFCGQCGSVTYCSREHQMADWNMCRHKEFCGKALSEKEKVDIQKLRLARTFAEKEIVSEPEGKDVDDEEEESQKAFFKENNPDEQVESKALVLAGDEAEEDTQVLVDDTFLQFQLKIQQNPDQVIRYDRVEDNDREPLWVQDNYKPASIPHCDKCQSPRTYEFQILSTLLNYLDVNHVAVDSLDWGSLYVYSCKNNCSIGYDYAEEIIWKQDFSQDGIQLGPEEAKYLRSKK